MHKMHSRPQYEQNAQRTLAGTTCTADLSMNNPACCCLRCWAMSLMHAMFEALCRQQALHSNTASPKLSVVEPQPSHQEKLLLTRKTVTFVNRNDICSAWSFHP